jgi:hypothetical protein
MPAGMPPEMVIKDWFAEAHGWNPRIVDELDLDEIFWLPVIKHARNIAQEQLSPKD